ncbi:MAG: Smr/MutS family protein [Candidatus Eisenbacteria bacterium]|nr:Smr/MutS family protein [Candidatus Eisenbacteria bacterium]
MSKSIRALLSRLFLFMSPHRGSAPARAGRPSADDDAILPSGPFVVTDDLDLHGLFPEQVPEILDEFLRNARALGIREVRIAHGKGKSVLRGAVWEFLEKHPFVIDFRQAPPDRGGWGATIARVLLEVDGEKAPPGE